MSLFTIQGSKKVMLFYFAFIAYVLGLTNNYIIIFYVLLFIYLLYCNLRLHTFHMKRYTI